MPVYKNNIATKDGRQWFFKTGYTTLDGIRKSYHSKKYSTRREALDAEAEFKIKSRNDADVSQINFEQLIELFINHKKNQVKETTMSNYSKKRMYLQPLYKVKLKDFTIEIYERWKQYINEHNLATRTKNDLYKFLKSILNYASDWYNFNFSRVYKKMTNFNNPNELPREMLFFSYEEFMKFLSVEDDLKFRCAYMILYYCGLRLGELRAITWKDINFEKNTISISKQITKLNTREIWHFSPTKTQKSNRVLPLNKMLVESLKILKEEEKKLLIGFNDNFFVVGDISPISCSRLADRKNRNCALAEVTQIRIHDFRHSCASLLLHKGAPIKMVSTFLGHSKVEETLNTYTHMMPSAFNEITDLIDEMNDNQIKISQD